MKKLLILSGKGGTGKTTTAAAFVKFSNAKAFADCDVDAPNLHIVTNHISEPERTDFLGSEKSVIDKEKCIGCGKCFEYCKFEAIEKDDDKFKVNEYACEGCGVCFEVCPVGAVSMNPDVAGELRLYKDDTSVFSTAKLKMGRGNSGKLVAEVKRNLPELDDNNVAIIDGSPGIGCPVIASISGVDLILIVAEPSLSGISDMDRIVKTAQVFHTPVAICVNKFDTCKENAKKIQDYCKENEITFVGKIPYDKNVSKAVNDNISIADVECEAKNALFEVYEETLKLLK